MGNFNWTNMRIAFAFAFLFIACFVGSEFVNAIPNQELGHDADAVVPEAPPAEFAQGLYDAKELYKKCGSRPFCPMAPCNHMRRVCRQVNFRQDCGYRPDYSRNASCRSRKALCNQRQRQWQDCKLRLRGLKL